MASALKLRGDYSAGEARRFARVIPAELLDRHGEIFDWQVGHQFPVDRLATGWRILLEAWM